MLKEAKRQLEGISLEQVKAILKKYIPAKYEKMIISNDAEIKRTNYYHSIINYKVAERKLYGLKFPLFENRSIFFTKYEGGNVKYGEKAIVERAQDIGDILKFEGIKKLDINANQIPNAFDFPFEIENNDFVNSQHPYFYPNYTYSQVCNACKGNHYITCPNCGGKHNWTCDKCSGTGQITCSTCGSRGKVKCTSGGLFSSSCNGTGKIKKTTWEGNDKIVTYETCPTCHGQGEVHCDTCKGKGIVKCTKCGGKGDITCSYCYSDRDRYGMIDCPECLTAGKTAQIVFTNTDIQKFEATKLLKSGADNNLENIQIKEHVKKDLELQLQYNNLNNNITDNQDEVSKKLFKVYEEDLELSKDSFPLLLQEEITYQVIPCVSFTFKHMIANTEHEVSIINIWDNPEIIFHSEAEAIKTSMKSVSKSVGGVFSKMFKTKSHKQKEDRKIEIKLMIYLAKSDGIIEEEEKIFLSEEISHLDDFTNSERKELFNLMNLVELPELTADDIKFTDPQKGIDIIEKLIQLANSDGEFEMAEKKLIEKIKKLME